MAARRRSSPSAAPPAEPAAEPARPPATASNETPPLPAWAPQDNSDGLVTVFLTNATRTSGGPVRA